MESYFKNESDLQQYKRIYSAIEGSDAAEILCISDIMKNIAQYATGVIIECSRIYYQQQQMLKCEREILLLDEEQYARLYQRNYNNEIFCIDCCESNVSETPNRFDGRVNPGRCKNMQRCSECDRNVWRPWNVIKAKLDRGNMMEEIDILCTGFCIECHRSLCGKCYIRHNQPYNCIGCIHAGYISVNPRGLCHGQRQTPPHSQSLSASFTKSMRSKPSPPSGHSDEPNDAKKTKHDEHFKSIQNLNSYRKTTKSGHIKTDQPPLKKSKDDDHSKNNDNADANQKK